MRVAAVRCWWVVSLEVSGGGGTQAAFGWARLCRAWGRAGYQLSVTAIMRARPYKIGLTSETVRPNLEHPRSEKTSKPLVQRKKSSEGAVDGTAPCGGGAGSGAHGAPRLRQRTAIQHARHTLPAKSSPAPKARLASHRNQTPRAVRPTSNDQQRRAPEPAPPPHGNRRVLRPERPPTRAEPAPPPHGNRRVLRRSDPRAQTGATSDACSDRSDPRHSGKKALSAVVFAELLTGLFGG